MSGAKTLSPLYMYVHKKGSLSEPTIFRAISLTNSISKIFINILTKILTNWCANNNIINEAQAGFRRN